MKTLFVKSILAIACLCFTFQLSAQEMEAKKYDNPQWKSIVHVDYHSGKTGRAIEIIDDYFKKAGEQAGTPGPESRLMMRTGQYDVVFIWGMDDISDMNYEVHPNGIKWKKALDELMGGKEKADELMEEYRSLVRSSKSELAMER